MPGESRRNAFRKLAKDLVGVDTVVYQQFDLDPTEPIIGQGDRLARIAIFGRDPGREEVRWRQPFIGAGGQKVRAVLYKALFGDEMPDFEASIEAGKYVFWANTVPYKPIGNKAWPQKVKRMFQPLMASVLLESWAGTHIITLGREAFLWFGLGLSKDDRKSLEAFWKQEDRFESDYRVKLVAPSGEARTLNLCPLPHPSPLNATWYAKFPGLLANRLQQLQFSRENWKAS